MIEYLRPRMALLPFIAIWGVYFGFLAFGGYAPIYPNFREAIILQVVFVALACAPMLFLPSSRPIAPHFLSEYDRAVLWFGLGIGAAALVSMLIDRIFVQNINYAPDICYARGQMTALGEARVGVSSPFSVIGQLFGYVYFVPATLIVARKVSRKVFWTIVTLACALLLLQSAVLATRSTIVMFGAFVLAALAIRASSEKSMPKIKLVDVGMTVLLVAASLAFIVAVFNCRATASHMSAAEYTSEAAEIMGAKAKAPDEPVVLSTSRAETGARAVATQSSGARLRALMELTMLYATHSAYTFAGIITLPGDGSMLLSNAVFLLNRIGLHVESKEVTLSGRFPSLPGALYYDMRILGLVFGGIALGLAMWVSAHYARTASESVIGFGIATAILVIAYTSPLLLASNFTIFPFICFGFLAIPAISLSYLKAKR